MKRSQDRPGMPGPVDPARAQVADQQLLAAEDIQRQETVVIVLAVAAAADLLAVHRIVGGIEVQDEPLRGPPEGPDELSDSSYSPPFAAARTRQHRQRC